MEQVIENVNEFSFFLKIKKFRNLQAGRVKVWLMQEPLVT